MAWQKCPTIPLAELRKWNDSTLLNDTHVEIWKQTIPVQVTSAQNLGKKLSKFGIEDLWYKICNYNCIYQYVVDNKPVFTYFKNDIFKLTNYNGYIIVISNTLKYYPSLQCFIKSINT